MRNHQASFRDSVVRWISLNALSTSKLNQARREAESTARRIDSKSQSATANVVVGLIATAISLAIAWNNLDQGWFPHDEGQLGQAAERVLHGELPHRDFDDMYTGGLSFLNAASFHIWGVNSQSMCWMLFAWFVPFVLSIYWLMSRFTRPWAAGLLTTLAAAWSIPMYSAAMPSVVQSVFCNLGIVCRAQVHRHRRQKVSVPGRSGDRSLNRVQNQRHFCARRCVVICSLSQPTHPTRGKRFAR